MIQAEKETNGLKQANGKNFGGYGILSTRINKENGESP